MRFIIGLLIGIAVGAALGMLAQPGSQAREAMGQYGRRDVSEAEDAGSA